MNTIDTKAMDALEISELDVIGQRIRNLRIRSGYSMEEILKFLCLSDPQDFYDWEEGKILPYYDELQDLAELFDVTIYDILFDNVIRKKPAAIADMTFQCLEEMGIAERQEVFKDHIEHAKALGRMPYELDVLAATLSDYGFTKQRDHMGGRIYSLPKVYSVLSHLEEIGMIPAETPFTILFSLAEPFGMFASDPSDPHKLNYLNGSYIMAVRINDEKEDHSPYFQTQTFCYGYDRICPSPEPEDLSSWHVRHVWFRWDDGIDRSPYPVKNADPLTSKKQKKTKKTTKKRKKKKMIDTVYFKQFNPNPCGNQTGDCTVRSLSGALRIPWKEAMDKLASKGDTAINNESIFYRVLEEEGFVPHPALLRNGRKLSGKAFCLEVKKLCKDGDCIIAEVGDSHVTAVMPINGRYRIMDRDDCSSETFGKFWVKSVKNYAEEEARIASGKPFAAGEQMIHPVFGRGTVTKVVHNAVYTDFGVNGLRRLAASWTALHCSRAAADAEQPARAAA